MTGRQPWDDDRGSGGIAGDWRRSHPRFDDPMSWSVPIGQASGVTVRVHALFLLIVVIALVKSLLADPVAGADALFDLPHMIAALCALFLLVLVHEIGHVVACRQVGGHADEILIWPLGGLAWCDPPRRWSAELWTAVGGLLVNAAVAVVTGVILGLTVGWRLSIIFPNPFNPHALVQMPGRALDMVFIVHWVNWVLLLVNALPLLPLDGGQALRALLARRLEPRDASRTTARIGFIGSIAVAVVAIVIGSWTLGALAFVSGLTCFVTLRRLDFTEAMEEGREDPTFAAEQREAERRAQRRADLEARRRASLAQEESRLDEILAKIGRDGRRSLTWAERRFLKKATRRRRRQ